MCVYVLCVCDVCVMYVSVCMRESVCARVCMCVCGCDVCVYDVCV